MFLISTFKIEKERKEKEKEKKKKVNR